MENKPLEPTNPTQLTQPVKSLTETSPGMEKISEPSPSPLKLKITEKSYDTKSFDAKSFTYNALFIVSILIFVAGISLLIYYVAYKGQTATTPEEIDAFNKKYYWIGLGSFGGSLVLVFIIGYIASKL